MPQLRFRKYTETEAKKQEAKKAKGPGCKRAIVNLLVFAILAIVLASLALKAPVRNSASGEYVPPASREQIAPYSRARWFLHDAHAAQLETDLGWYHRCKLTPALNVGDLDSAGFRPFIFVDETGATVEITTLENLKGPFGLAILPVQGTLGRFLSRRSLQNSSVVGKSWLETQDEEISVNPDAATTIHGQFLPQTPQFSEEYVCFLAQVWDAAVARYVAIYHKPPESLAVLLDGIGLEPNPACVWPLGARAGGVACEGGIIDGRISYWRVTLLGGASRGQARYYDTYSTTFDDPDTPLNVTTREGSSPVADPGLVEGRRNVMFNLEILRDLLESAKQTADASGNDTTAPSTPAS